MLYLIHKANDPELAYKGGEDPIVHLQADFHSVVAWAASQDRRWAVTLSNAGSRYFEDRTGALCLEEVQWPSVQSQWWSGRDVPGSVKEEKQAEFLVEHSFPWHLVEKIGVKSNAIAGHVHNSFGTTAHRPTVEIHRDWYYG